MWRHCSWSYNSFASKASGSESEAVPVSTQLGTSGGAWIVLRKKTYFLSFHLKANISTTQPGSLAPWSQLNSFEFVGRVPYCLDLAVPAVRIPQAFRSLKSVGLVLKLSMYRRWLVRYKSCISSMTIFPVLPRVPAFGDINQTELCEILCLFQLVKTSLSH